MSTKPLRSFQFPNDENIYKVECDAPALTELSDVEVTNIQDGQTLQWDSTEERFVNANSGGGGGLTITPIALSDFVTVSNGTLQTDSSFAFKMGNIIFCRLYITKPSRNPVGYVKSPYIPIYPMQAFYNGSSIAKDTGQITSYSTGSSAVCVIYTWYIWSGVES